MGQSTVLIGNLWVTRMDTTPMSPPFFLIILLPLHSLSVFLGKTLDADSSFSFRQIHQESLMIFLSFPQKRIISRIPYTYPHIMFVYTPELHIEVGECWQFRYGNLIQTSRYTTWDLVLLRVTWSSSHANSSIPPDDSPFRWCKEVHTISAITSDSARSYSSI